MIGEHGKEKAPILTIREESIEHPAPPTIINVTPGDGCATIEFDFDSSQLIPKSAPYMSWWFEVEGRHCRATGTQNSNEFFRS